MKDKNKNKKKIFVSALTLAFVGNAFFAIGAMAWGPERTTYTNEEPATHAVFNSITNNQAVGDERDFVRVVEVNTEGGHNTYSNEVHVTGGKDYEVYIYYHNNASTTYNDSAHDYAGVARKTSVSAMFPTEIEAGEKGEVYAAISSPSTDPGKVWDEAYFIADEKVKLVYISDSAKIYNDWSLSGSVISASELFSADGAFIGVRELNGLIPGCDEFSGAVIFRVRAIPIVEPTSTFEMEKKVSVDGGKTWVDDATLSPGDEAEFKITYHNTGTLTQTVTAFDTLENGVGMEYVAGSTRIVANGTEMIIKDENGGKLFNGGVEVGDIASEGTVEIYYKVKMKAADSFTCGKTVLYNLAGISAKAASDSGTATQHDKVRIEVNREGKDCNPTVIPETGPAEIVLSGVIIAGLLVGIFYYINSKKTLKRLESDATGNSLDKPEQM